MREELVDRTGGLNLSTSVGVARASMGYPGSHAYIGSKQMASIGHVAGITPSFPEALVYRRFCGVGMFGECQKRCICLLV